MFESVTGHEDVFLDELLDLAHVVVFWFFLFLGWLDGFVKKDF